MANIFTITTPQQTLKANAGGEATTVFTVTNATSRPLRGFVKIKALGNTQSEWLKIDGETERDFAAGGTHQFTAAFSKPKAASAPAAAQAAESFPFRLDAISAINPDEDFTEGPVVTVEISGQPVEPVKKPFPWLWVIIGAVVLLIIIGVVAWLLLRGGGGSGSGNTNTTPTPTATPTATPGTRVVLDFIDKARLAVWKNDQGVVLPVDGASTPTGVVMVVKNAQMESDFTEPVVLHTHPRWEVNGAVTGTYDLPEPIDGKDRFRARIGFLKGAGAGNLKVRLLLNGTVIAEMPKIYEGALREFEVDLSRYRGQSGKIALQALAVPTSAQGWICWINPRIEREP
ncbi:MAG TPA: hypothetical protein VF721_22715 [Pyrinomonadaceae bacterium]|jgi:hypothetical protein